jgi:hypothetical protein
LGCSVLDVTVGDLIADTYIHPHILPQMRMIVNYFLLGDCIAADRHNSDDVAI